MLPTELVDCYTARFVNRADCHYRAWADKAGKVSYSYEHAGKDDKDGRFPFRPADAELVRDHLEGGRTCSWPAVTSDGMSRWGCFDDDSQDYTRLDKMAQVCIENGWHPLLESRRPERSGHLWLLFDGPVLAADLMTLLDVLAKAAGIADNAPNFETFPKSATKRSAVRGPLGVHLKTGQPGIFNGCLAQDIKSQLAWLNAQPLNSSDAFATFSPELARRREAARKWMAPQIVTPRTIGAGGANFLDLVNHAGIEAKPNGKDLAAPCPLCRQEGHDKTGDNLRLSRDGRLMSCVYGGVACQHKGKDILKALKDGC